jgi:hypothetical protein
MSVYPKWLYHSKCEPKVVKSEVEHKALGGDWKESPADCAPSSHAAPCGAVAEPAPEAAPKKRSRGKAQGGVEA